MTKVYQENLNCIYLNRPFKPNLRPENNHSDRNFSALFMTEESFINISCLMFLLNPSLFTFHVVNIYQRLLLSND